MTILNIKNERNAIFDARIILLYERQDKATTRLKLSYKVGGVCAFFFWLHDINSISFKFNFIV